MNVVQSAITSSRFNRVLMWVAAAVLLAGIVFAIYKVWTRGDSGGNRAVPSHLNPPKPVPVNKSIMPFTKLEPGAQSTIKQFLVNGVNLKNLGAAYFLADADFRNGSTHKQWRSGSSPVIPAQFKSLDSLVLRVKPAPQGERAVQVDLPAYRGVGPQTMFVVVKKFGSRWLVDYWGSIWNPPIPTVPGSSS